jgi:hypothetical protein
MVAREARIRPIRSVYEYATRLGSGAQTDVLCILRESRLVLEAGICR